MNLKNTGKSIHSNAYKGQNMDCVREYKAREQADENVLPMPCLFWL